MRVLNVGGATKKIPLPEIYDGWEHILLDIDPDSNADLLMDARDLPVPGQKFDAIYCSHNLEHFYRHDALKVLRGFAASLVDDGYAHIRVPNLAAIMKRFVVGQLDIDSVLYVSPGGEISPHDMLYGHQVMIEHAKKEFYAHKMGFTAPLMGRMLREAGFKTMHYAEHAPNLELEVFAHLQEL